MIKKKMSLVSEYLENISGAALADRQAFFKVSVHRRNGVYALYRRNKLYYVGLAVNLQGRIKHHLKDRHAGLWDRFSMYLTKGDDHIRELESLLLRIVNPPGNRQIGRFKGAKNLGKDLRRWIRWEAKESEIDVFGTRRRKPRPGQHLYHTRPLRGKIVRTTALKARLKGRDYHARILVNGAILYARKRYDSPTEAAVGALKHRRRVNGWWFWQYERAPGDWVRLRELRK
jgi:GIY-YIG catalytic domain